VRSSEVLPTLLGPMMRIFAPAFCARRSSAPRIFIAHSPHDEIERRSQRAAGATVAVATERTANGFGISTVLDRDRECDGGIARAGVGGRIALVVPEE